MRENAETSRFKDFIQLLSDWFGLDFAPNDLQRVRGIYDKLDYGKFKARLEDPVFGPMRDDLFKFLPPGDVLEIAIANGENLSRYKKDHHVVGLDLSIAQLALAEKRAKDFGVSFEALEGDAANLSFSTGRFNATVCSLGMCTFAQPLTVLGELMRVCPEGPYLFLEHTLPQAEDAWFLRAFLTAIAPLAKRKLGCHTTRDTIANIKSAGMRITHQKESLGGMLVTIVAEPR